jgi:hypothetical protein
MTGGTPLLRSVVRPEVCYNNRAQMERREVENFYNEGFGWVCKACEREFASDAPERSRLLREGEAESKQPELSGKALARWTDAERKTLVCPRCGIEEPIVFADRR